MKKPKVVFITQARMGSTRLPGKVMKIVEGQTVLYWFLKRAQKCKTPNLICVATTENPTDDTIVEYVQKHFPDIHITRGSEQDVLSRYALAAKETEADIVIRVTSDCPFMDWDLVDRCVNTLIEKKADAVRTLKDHFPIGLDVEVFTRQALETAHKNAKDPAEREHVGPYIYRTHPEVFKIEWIENEGTPWPECRLTLDYPEDFKLLKQLLGVVGPTAHAEKYQQFLSDHSEVALLNSMYCY